jgi:hypothetical protein
MTAAVNLRGSGAHPNDVALHDVGDAPDLPQASGLPSWQLTQPRRL